MFEEMPFCGLWVPSGVKKLNFQKAYFVLNSLQSYVDILVVTGHLLFDRPDF